MKLIDLISDVEYIEAKDNLESVLKNKGFNIIMGSKGYDIYLHIESNGTQRELKDSGNKIKRDKGKSFEYIGKTKDTGDSIVL